MAVNMISAMREVPMSTCRRLTLGSAGPRRISSHLSSAETKLIRSQDVTQTAHLGAEDVMRTAPCTSRSRTTLSSTCSLLLMNPSVVDMFDVWKLLERMALRFRPCSTWIRNNRPVEKANINPSFGTPVGGFFERKKISLHLFRTD